MQAAMVIGYAGRKEGLALENNRLVGAEKGPDQGAARIEALEIKKNGKHKVMRHELAKKCFQNDEAHHEGRSDHEGSFPHRSVRGANHKI